MIKQRVSVFWSLCNYRQSKPLWMQTTEWKFLKLLSQNPKIKNISTSSWASTRTTTPNSRAESSFATRPTLTNFSRTLKKYRIMTLSQFWFQIVGLLVIQVILRIKNSKLSWALLLRRTFYLSSIKVRARVTSKLIQSTMWVWRARDLRNIWRSAQRRIRLLQESLLMAKSSVWVNAKESKAMATNGRVLLS